MWWWVADDGVERWIVAAPLSFKCTYSPAPPPPQPCLTMGGGGGVLPGICVLSSFSHENTQLVSGSAEPPAPRCCTPAVVKQIFYTRMAERCGDTLCENISYCRFFGARVTSHEVHVQGAAVCLGFVSPAWE